MCRKVKLFTLSVKMDCQCAAPWAIDSIAHTVKTALIVIVIFIIIIVITIFCFQFNLLLIITILYFIFCIINIVVIIIMITCLVKKYFRALKSMPVIFD